MRVEKFKMERPNLVVVGQEVEITEIETANYSYIIEPAVAMSGVFTNDKRIKSKTGIVQEIQETPRGYYVLVAFDE